MKVNKHRAWDSVNNCFARIATYIDSEGNFYADCDPHGVDISGKRTIGFRQQYVFGGMFTGLVDYNGIEIYDGDIISVPKFYDATEMTSNPRETYFVVFAHGAFMLSELPSIETVSCYDEILSVVIRDCDGDIEVIGNIYESPELINEKQKTNGNG